MVQNPLVSVIIPCYNYGEFLGEAVDSVLNQTYQNFEIIIIDDGSTDNTKEVVKNFQKKDKRIGYYYQKNKGPSAARNLGAAKSNGNYICFLDADDIFKKSHLGDSINFLEKNKDLSMVFSNARFFSDAGQNKAVKFRNIKFQKKLKKFLKSASEKTYKDNVFLKKDSLNCFLLYSVVATCTEVFKKEVFLEAGGFKKLLKRGQDRELDFRIARRFRIGFINKKNAMIRVHNKNKPTIGKDILSISALKSVYDCKGLKSSEKKALDKTIANLYFDLGYKYFKSCNYKKAFAFYKKSFLKNVKLKTFIVMIRTQLISKYFSDKKY